MPRFDDEQEDEVITGELMRCPDIFRARQAVAFESEMKTETLSADVLGSLNGVALAFPLLGAQAVAGAISSDHQPIWFVNFPLELSASVQNSLRDYQQVVLDFRCWSSLKWWTEVFTRIPVSDDPLTKIKQTSEFAMVACRDMTQMPWLKTTMSPQRSTNAIQCPIGELHPAIIAGTMSKWFANNPAALAPLETVLQAVVGSISEATFNYNDTRTVVTEKYEYMSEAQSIKSSVRLLCFEISRSFYDVQSGKSTQIWVNCDMSYLEYEAEFKIEEWKKSQNSIDEQQKPVLQEFVKKQTVDIGPDSINK
ncbi:hypothetical protein M406DRAFT_358073 [Cryphonectria parasitica EP155]|uniref:Uncharacterized protein n=1 Tax=Cryphonectria parasitica (strain ATCC 38755 / EP155) TaxID=660469 RepID=A0A9P4XVM9_CRYP1|nr:uncharacterized protein M406DRAFT_358073 [Cryphonectria parasitica EP155]KAF3761666.1 hypothetical protein M406DRAFT_358073 [Cryphonectria parasitica EP155]